MLELRGVDSLLINNDNTLILGSTCLMLAVSGAVSSSVMTSMVRGVESRPKRVL